MDFTRLRYRIHDFLADLRAGRLRDQRWLVPALSAVIVVCLTWTAFSLARGAPTPRLDSPRDLLIDELRTKLAADDRFGNIECLPSVHDENVLVLTGEVEDPEHTEALRQMLAEVQTGVQVEMQVAAPGEVDDWSEDGDAPPE